MNIIKAIVRFFFGTGADSIPSKIAGGISAVTLVAAVTPFVIWLVKNKDDSFVVVDFSYGELALFVFAVWVVLEFVRKCDDTS